MKASGLRDQGLTLREKRRLGLFAIAGLFGAPGAWLLQVILSETVSAEGCYSVSKPRAEPALPHLHGWLYGIGILAMLTAILCAAAAVYGFALLAGRERRAKARHEGEGSDPIPWRAREEERRKRFVALCSALIGCGFVVSLLFTGAAGLFVGTCSFWH